MWKEMENGTGGGSSNLYTKSGTKTISSSNLTIDTGLGANLRIFKFSGTATNSYGSDMKFAGMWDYQYPNKIISAGAYSSNGELVTAKNSVGNGRTLGIKSVTNGVVTFMMPTTSGWTNANPSISWNAG